jgi:hypothetical protein
MQQGVESVVEVTTTGGVTSDWSGDPSPWLLLLQRLCVVDRAVTIIVSSITPLFLLESHLEGGE